jgi:hypothetical protein
LKVRAYFDDQVEEDEIDVFDGIGALTTKKKAKINSKAKK